MKFHIRRPARLASLALVAGLALAACGNDDDGGSGGGEGTATAGGGEVSITFLPKNLGNPYFDTSNAGGEKAIGEFGGTYAQVGPDAASPDAQVPFINTAAQQGVSALVVSANDPNAICPALNQATGADIAVVTFDSDTNLGTVGAVHPRQPAGHRHRHKVASCDVVVHEASGDLRIDEATN